MDFIFYVVLYLTQLRLSHQEDLPDRLSEILDKLIEATENKNDAKTNSVKIPESSKQSKIIYVKAKSDPNLIWEVKYENITDRGIEGQKEETKILEDNIEINYDGSLDSIGYFDSMNSIEATKNVNIENIPNSVKYTLKYNLPEQENDLSYEYEDISASERSGKIQDEIANKYLPTHNDKNKFSRDFLRNLTKLLASKKDNDSNALKLNKNYEKLLKEIHDIKALYKKENFKSNDNIFLPQPSLQHPNIALKPLPYIPILLNYHLISDVDVLSSNANVQQTPYYRRYLPSLRKQNVLTNYLQSPITVSRIVPKTRNTYLCKSCR